MTMINDTIVTRQIAGQYFQTSSGQWWIMNPQHGWVEVPATSRALRSYMSTCSDCGGAAVNGVCKTPCGA